MHSHQVVELLKRIGSYGLVGIAVASLEEVYQLTWAWKFEKLKPGPVAIFLLPLDMNVL